MAPPIQPLKSYLIAPGVGFPYRRGSSIALGNIFENALEVDEIPISFGDAENLPPKVDPAATENNREIIEDRGSKGGVEAWVEYMRTFRGGISVEQAKNAHVVYQIKDLETDTFTGANLREYFDKRVKEEEILQRYLSKGPIYMITGIKYAKDLTWEIRAGTTNEAEATLSSRVVEDVQAGGRAWREGAWTSLQKGEIKEEAIFAYQVHRIALKGWRKKTLETKLNRDGAALSDESSDDEDDGIENTHAVGYSIECGLVNEIDDLAAESGMEIWNTDGTFMHAS
ncbi:hypothetical protein GGR51DRAFT_543267 [Nemania sp. FL0031]|nr:hypothetical protein GGR51DRAFT_543267 [Nemania sp. FL0031]